MTTGCRAAIVDVSDATTPAQLRMAELRRKIIARQLRNNRSQITSQTDLGDGPAMGHVQVHQVD